jgi:branched-subunit amino acid aminotransferase/4-amino-4-deoxychorismate lyase
LKTGRKGNELYGCDQALWLLHDYVTEVGTMNFFLFWKNE